MVMMQEWINGIGEVSVTASSGDKRENKLIVQTIVVTVWVHTGLQLGNRWGNWSGSGSMIWGGIQFSNGIHIAMLWIGTAQQQMPNLFLMGPARLFAKP